MTKLGLHHLVLVYLVAVVLTCVGALYCAYHPIGNSTYPKFEIVKITNINETNNTNSTWTVTITLENWGSRDAKINNILLCGKPYIEYKNSNMQDAVIVTNPNNFATDGLTVACGEKKTLELNIQEVSLFSSGSKIDFLLHSLSDQEYPLTLNLP